MSFSKLIENYPGSYRRALEIIGNNQYNGPIYFGPYEDLKAAQHERFRFYAYLRLVRKSPLSTPEMIEGARRVIVRLTPDFALKIDDLEDSQKAYAKFEEMYGKAAPVTEENRALEMLHEMLAEQKPAEPTQSQFIEPPRSLPDRLELERKVAEEAAGETKPRKYY